MYDILIYKKEGDLMTSKAQIEATKKYLEKLDEIKIRVPSGKKEEYKKLAEAEGKSLNQFIIDKIEQ